MSSHGIVDKVAIIGMGCTRFGELWDRSVDDMLVEAVGDAVDSAGVELADVDAFWLGTLASGSSGLTLSRPLGIDYKPVTRVENYCATGSEAFRNACYAVASGAYDVAMAVGVEKLWDSGYSGLLRADPPGDGTAPELGDRTGGLLADRSRLLRQVRRRPEQMREAMTHVDGRTTSTGRETRVPSSRPRCPGRRSTRRPRWPAGSACSTVRASPTVRPPR